MLAGDQTMRSLATMVEVREPDPDTALDMVSNAAQRLAAEFELAIEPKAIERAVGLCTTYILNDRLPRRAVAVLRGACECLHFERAIQGGERRTVEVAEWSRWCRGSQACLRASCQGWTRTEARATSGRSAWTSLGQPEAPALPVGVTPPQGVSMATDVALNSRFRPVVQAPRLAGARSSSRGVRPTA
jgi:hypothetical protein